MDKNTKLTLAELLRRKEQMLEAKKIKKTVDLYVKSIDSVITIEEPNLKSKDAQEAFGCDVPMDIVDVIFAPGEIPQIAIECMKLAGYMGGVEAVKN